MTPINHSTQPLIDLAHKEMALLYPDFINDLRFLVGQDRGSDCKDGLDQAIDWMEAQVMALGCETRIFDDHRHGKHLVATLRGEGRGKWVIFGHMDTVWEKGTVADWPMQINGDIATGPGVVDNTGGSLAGLYTLKLIRKMNYSGFEEIVFINNCDEEIESPSSKPIFLQEARGKDYAICLESPSFADEIIGERAGAANFYIEVQGKGAHPGVSPEEGINAGLEICKKIIAMSKVKGEDHVLHMSVVNIKAGTGVNTVCEHAEAKVFVRVKSWDEFDMLCRRYQEIVDHNYVPGTTATLRIDMNHGPMERLPGSKHLSDTMIAVGRQVGLDLKDVWCGGCADSSFTSEAGIPTLCGVGPFGQNYHTRVEMLDISSIVPRVTLVFGTILSISEQLRQS